MKKLLFLFMFPILCFGQNSTAAAYFTSGHQKFQIKDYYGAIADFSKTIQYETNSREVQSWLVQDTYFYRSRANSALKLHKAALSDINKVIEMGGFNENRTSRMEIYQLRGLIKYEAGGAGIFSNCCADFRKACNDGSQMSCNMINSIYKNQLIVNALGCNKN